MLGLKNVSVRARLFALVAVNALGLVAVLALAAYVTYTYRVGGPVSDRLSAVQEFQARVSPATLYVRGAYVTCQEIADAATPAEVAALTGVLREHEAAFARDYQAALTRPNGPEVRHVLVTELQPTTIEFFRVARDEFLPLVGRPDQAAVDRVLAQRVKPAFARHAEVAERVVGMAQEAARAEEAAALEATHYWTRVMVAVGAACLAVLLGVGWVIVNGMVAKTRRVIDHVRESCLSVLSAASQIAATARQQETTVAGLNDMTTQIAAAVREITAAGKALSGTMGEVNERANQAAALAAAGREGLGGMERTMGALVDATASVSAKLTSIREKADNINLVVTTITKVADQTNLLSINAAIEAEKAGEFGRGFLVIAREIRRLADQTAVATLDIESLVRLMQTAVAAGVMQMDKFTDEVRTSVTRVGQISAQTGQVIAEVGGLSTRFEQVNTGMRDQQVGAAHINEAMGNMSENIRRTAASLVEFNAATAQLRESISGLNNELAGFRV
ncbi:methyl-accepting chemotaxis protein : Methyl-accepting chemotaxis protein OS=Singulisphaera acidiphila (strain ATCC BAA-1392 / DSM 18658 / VKM B-2454 / MOB10) GN=Sinac_4835 PE=4 SV=1: MCPsignal [Gemmataceae bacterium]|nr:methyl-accepting chemotaxis protein : Methyl-accepting chemotaxis protein OS=Singulisphaera acidiphila (strain ATCC BAA-1392 / DSM 18658 / VKM B-2454 / MOB10) GN=Sinac_4835 PE=4 SV=1: MCPsignal [Gemmataceae bacterium]VTT96877.1 methyl-accepting chemotaxis protein : Methyl-accepting chemotaxis protein OS=Singulisphaera acidiphila (strain ATCC BAA-1392 / DSM 18658 / VKM B-2454 / MOB10) GN=Sinac_4835 PE=4 SV=1: MCPsignal [Gemmataceae bacterium]